MSKKFETQKRIALKRLEDAREEGKADEDIAKLLDLINALPDFYTTSSCAGRICLLETPKKHDKLQSNWLGKWHTHVSLNDITSALKNHKRHVVYLQAECPILHVMARDLESAQRILFAAQESGFKRSGIQAINPERVAVEICSTEVLEVPVAEEGRRLVNDIYLAYLVNIANIKFDSGREKLTRLQNRLENGI